MNCKNCAVIDSYISNIHVVGQDSQAIAGWNTPGPLKINDNYLEGAAENVMFGGNDPTVLQKSSVSSSNTTSATLASTTDLQVGQVIDFTVQGKDGNGGFTTVRAINGETVQFDALSAPPDAGSAVSWGAVASDVEMRFNTINKPSSWKVGDPAYAGIHWEIKDLFEVKCGQRIWLDSNLINNVWPDAQEGYAIDLTVRNQGGQAPFCTAQDVTISDNIITNTYRGLELKNTDYIYPSGPGQNFTVTNNLWLKMVDMLIVNSSDGLIFNHNTVINGNLTESVEDFAVRAGNVFTNNIVISSSYGGFHYNNADAPNWSLIFPGFVMQANVMDDQAGDPYIYMSQYASENYVSPVSGVGFVSTRWTLAPNSPYKGKATDGTDIGINASLLGGAFRAIPGK